MLGNIADGSVIIQTFEKQVFEEEIAQVGFRVEALYGDDAWAPFHEDTSPFMIGILRKADAPAHLYPTELYCGLRFMTRPHLNAQFTFGLDLLLTGLRVRLHQQ